LGPGTRLIQAPKIGSAPWWADISLGRITATPIACVLASWPN